MKVPIAVIGLAASLSIGVGAVGVFLLGLFGGSTVTGDGQMPIEWLAACGVFIAFGLAFVAWTLWKVVYYWAWPAGEAAEGLVMTITFLWVGALAVLAIWVTLRVTHVIGPIVTDRGL
jgi:hypothetical protein